MIEDVSPSYRVWRQGRPWVYDVDPQGVAPPHEWQLHRGLLELAESGQTQGRTLLAAAPYPRSLLDEALRLLDGPMEVARGYHAPGRIPPEQAGFERAFLLLGLFVPGCYAIVPAATGRWRLVHKPKPGARWLSIMVDTRFLVLVDCAYRLLGIP